MDENALAQARSAAPYEVARLYLPDGSVSPHYADELTKHGMQWDVMMQDSHFAEVVANELRAEETADGLDRVRLGANEPDPRYLRTSHAIELLDLAQEMLRAAQSA